MPDTSATSTPSVTFTAFWDLCAQYVSKLAAPSFDPWRIAGKVLHGEPLDADELAFYTRCTGRTTVPRTEDLAEFVMVAGRRGGKNQWSAIVLAYRATIPTYDLAPGETAIAMLLAATRRQARISRNYVAAIFREVPMLADLVARETTEGVELTNGCAIEIYASKVASVRGVTACIIVADELAFWDSDDLAADRDEDVLNALRPALLTTNGPLLITSTPYARSGALYDLHERHYGDNTSESTLVWSAASTVMNPTLPVAVIDKALAKDSTAALSEYGDPSTGEIFFRSDIESFVDLRVVEAAVDQGRVRSPFVGKVNGVQPVTYRAFLDPSGGRGDSFAAAVGHLDGDVVVIDAVLEVLSPFDPADACGQVADLLLEYNLTTAVGDAYAGVWPAEMLRKEGIRYSAAAKPKSALYLDALPLLNSGRIRLPDSPRLVKQIAGLERRTARGGRDSIDHRRGAHDDLANVVLGLAATMVEGKSRQVDPVVWERFVNSPADLRLPRRDPFPSLSIVGNRPLGAWLEMTRGS